MPRLAFNAYTVVDYIRDGKRQSKWLKIGGVFAHKDGEGFDIALAALPVNGRIVLRKLKSKEALAVVLDEDEEEGARVWFGDDSVCKDE